MITFDLGLKDVDQIPNEVAEWLTPRNAKYPGVNFLLDRSPLRDVDREMEERGMRKFRENYSKMFSPFGTWMDPERFAAGGVSFLYGQESWSVRIIGGVTQSGEIKHLQTIEQSEMGSFMSLPQDLRNEIAGFDLERLERLDHLEKKLGIGIGSGVRYAERRTELTPFAEHPETFIKVEWDSRREGIRMSGKEFRDILNDPEKKDALNRTLRDQREGNIS